jgi:hypothetical protein
MDFANYVSDDSIQESLGEKGTSGHPNSVKGYEKQITLTGLKINFSACVAVLLSKIFI